MSDRQATTVDALESITRILEQQGETISMLAQAVDILSRHVVSMDKVQTAMLARLKVELLA